MSETIAMHFPCRLTAPVHVEVLLNAIDQNSKDQRQRRGQKPTLKCVSDIENTHKK